MRKGLITWRLLQHSRMDIVVSLVFGEAEHRIDLMLLVVVVVLQGDVQLVGLGTSGVKLVEGVLKNA